MEKLNIPYTVICEGKYDKIKLSGIINATIMTTDGFGVFANKEKAELFRRLAGKNGVIIITDSDGAGFVIRNHIKGIIPKEKIINIYIPEIYGKEKRKSVASKEGTVGVEGVPDKLLRELFAPYAKAGAQTQSVKKITMSDLYSMGLSGVDGSDRRRAELIKRLSLPSKMTAKALLDVLNSLYSYDKIKQLSEEIKQNEENI